MSLSIFAINGYESIIAGTIKEETEKFILFDNLLSIIIKLDDFEELEHLFMIYYSDLLYNINSNFKLYKNNIKARNDEPSKNFILDYYGFLEELDILLNGDSDED